MCRYIGAFFSIGITFYMAMIYGSTAIALLGFAQAAFVVLSFLFLIYMSGRIRFHLEIPITMAEQGQWLTMRVSGLNRSRFGCSKAYCKVVTENIFFHKKSRQWIGAEFGGEKNCKCEYQLQLSDSGGYEVTLDKIRIYDLSGIFYIHRGVRQTAGIEVIPVFDQVVVRLTEGVLNFFGEAEVYDELRGGIDPGETFQIREFREGDRIQSIHWKLSARTDELMVRELGRPKACPVVLIMETGTGWKDDRVLSAIAGISFSMMDAGCPHYMAWYGQEQQDAVRIRVDNEESFYMFLAYFMKERSGKQEQKTRELYEHKYGAELLLHKLVLNEKLELYQDDQLLIRLADQRGRAAGKKQRNRAAGRNQKSRALGKEQQGRAVADALSQLELIL